MEVNNLSNKLEVPLNVARDLIEFTEGLGLKNAKFKVDKEKKEIKTEIIVHISSKNEDKVVKYTIYESKKIKI